VPLLIARAFLILTSLLVVFFISINRHALADSVVFSLWMILSSGTVLMYLAVTTHVNEEEQWCGFWSSQHTYESYDGLGEEDHLDEELAAGICFERSANCIPPYYFLSGRWSKANSLLFISIVFNASG